MADGSFPTLVSRNRDINSATNVMFVNLSDGTDSADITAAGALTVETNLGKAEDSVHVSGDTGVMALAVRQDTQVDFGADGDYVPLSINADGELRVTTEAQSTAEVKVDDSAFAVGTDSVAVSGYLADETAPDSVDEGDVGAARMTLDRKQLFVGVDSTTDSQRWTIDAGGALQVDVTDQIPGVGATNLGKAEDAAHADGDTGVAVWAVRNDTLAALAGTDGDYAPFQVDADGALYVTAQVSKDENANSETNPIFVQTVNTAVSGEEVHDYDTAASVASDATSNHDYTVTGTTFLLKSVIFSGSGNVKAEIQGGPIAGLSTVAVGFLTGRGGDTKQLFFDPPFEVPATGTGTLRVIRTNRQGSAVDVYSTIIGSDV